MSENTISRRTFFWNAAIIGFRDNTLLIFLYRTFNMRIFQTRHFKLKALN